MKNHKNEQDKHILAIIPARGGSKRIPQKNIINLAGKPLIQYTIAAAQKSKYITRIIVSTDDKEIQKICLSLGVEVKERPPELATDTIKTQEAIIHLHNTLKTEGYEPDIMVLLQPTSPLRTAEDIDKTIEEILIRGADSTYTVCKVKEHPSLMITLNEENEPQALLQETFKRSQDFAIVYIKNGAVYAWKREVLEHKKDFYGAKLRAVIMSQERSLDIDTLEDLEQAEQQLKKKTTRGMRI
jgi:CMP-N-acetylneuraminic acid synthetase